MKRFKTGENPTYDEHYIRLKNQSDILTANPGERPNITTVFWDKENCQERLVEYQGDDQGFYLRNNQKTLALIPSVKLRLQKIEDDFERYQKQRVNQGFAKPTEMLPELFEKQSKLFALQDILEEEAAKILHRLATMIDEETHQEDDMVLQYGLQLIGKLRDGVLAEMDGQTCTQNEEGLVIISDQRSPFNGMAISDYRILAKKWQSERKASDVLRLSQLREDAIANGSDLPQYYSSRNQKVSKDLLPQWPKGVKNHLETSVQK
jgi:hypothetical protein